MVARIAASLIATAMLALSLTGCGSGGKKQSAEGSGSVPVKTVVAHAITVTVKSGSSSMEPTIHCAPPGPGCEGSTDDGLVLREPAVDVKRADIIEFQPPSLANRECGTDGEFVKRLIGLPGDLWEERSGYVYINGKRLSEPYVKAARRDTQSLTLRDIPPRNTYTRIPKDYFLMMGDNRSSSCDSRRWGLVPRGSLIGKVVEIRRPTTG
jgi:signal peptidase I